MKEKEKKILNLFTKKNNIFTPAKCVLCGNTFEPGEDIYLVDKEDKNSLVCDKCAKEDYKRGGIYRPIKEEEDNKLVRQSLKLFKGVKIVREDKTMTKEEENKELKDLLEKVQKIISTPIVGFTNKSYEEIKTMVRDIHELDRRLMHYTQNLEKIQKFNFMLDSFNRKDDYKTMFEVYCGQIHHADEDEIPF